MTADAERAWQHPWLRIERLVHAFLADRICRGANEPTDRFLVRVLAERRENASAGWFN